MAKPKIPVTRVVGIETLKGDPANANKGTERGNAMVGDSLQNYGAGRSILLDKNGLIVAGNKTWEKAGEAGFKEVVIIPTDGRQLVAVQRTDLDLINDPRAKELALADNRSGEVNLSWDPEVLKALEADVDLGKFFTEEELAAIIGDDGGQTGNAPEAEIGKAAELQKKWETASGQLWEIPTKLDPEKCHRIMVGDCRDREVVQRLMNGKKAGLMNTDPPYGVAYANDDRPNPGVAKPRVANDELTNKDLQKFLEDSFRPAAEFALTKNAAWYMWHPMLLQGYFAAAAAAAAAGLIIHRQIIWVKPVLLLGRGHYHWKHELCFMGWVQGNEPPDYGRGAGERDQTTVWEIASVTNAEREEFGHSTPKPTELFKIPIIKHLRSGELCYDPFAGSFPQLVAAELTGRICYALDIEPSFVAVGLERMAAMGLDPKLVKS